MLEASLSPKLTVSLVSLYCLKNYDKKRLDTKVHVIYFDIIISLLFLPIIFDASFCIFVILQVSFSCWGMVMNTLPLFDINSISSGSGWAAINYFCIFVPIIPTNPICFSTSFILAIGFVYVSFLIQQESISKFALDKVAHFQLIWKQIQKIIK